MRKLFPMLAVAIAFAGVGLIVRAADEKERTLTGEGQCAKCSLNETEKCQNAVVVDEAGKKTTYYMPQDNAVAKKFHRVICQTKKTIKVVGTVKEEDGKMILTPTSIEEVKK